MDQLKHDRCLVFEQGWQGVLDAEARRELNSDGNWKVTQQSGKRVKQGSVPQTEKKHTALAPLKQRERRTSRQAVRCEVDVGKGPRPKSSAQLIRIAGGSHSGGRQLVFLHFEQRRTREGDIKRGVQPAKEERRGRKMESCVVVGRDNGE